MLEDIQQKATEVAIIKGADEKTFDIALDQAIEKNKNGKQNIKEVEDVFSEEAKTVFNTASEVSSSAKEFADTLNTAFSTGASGSEIKEVIGVTISTVADDNIINSNEKTEGFVIKGTALAGSNLTVKVTEKLDPGTSSGCSGEWTVDFRLTNSDLMIQKSAIQALSYPLTISATAKSLGGSTYTDNKNVELNEQVSVITIDSISVGGDNILNISEWSSGLVVSGKSNAEEGSKVKISLLKKLLMIRICQDLMM